VITHDEYVRERKDPEEHEHFLYKAKRYLSSTVEQMRAGLVAPVMANLKLPVTWSVAIDTDVAEGIVRVAENGALLWLGQHTGSIHRLAFTPDGHTLASGGDDAVIRLWDVSTGKPLQTLSSQNSPIYALAWSPDGSRLASGSFDGSIHLWEMQGRQAAQSGTATRILRGHSGLVWSVAFAPNGRTLASGSFDQTVNMRFSLQPGLHTLFVLPELKVTSTALVFFLSYVDR